MSATWSGWVLLLGIGTYQLHLHASPSHLGRARSSLSIPCECPALWVPSSQSRAQRRVEGGLSPHSGGPQLGVAGQRAWGAARAPRAFCPPLALSGPFKVRPGSDLEAGGPGAWASHISGLSQDLPEVTAGTPPFISLRNSLLPEQRKPGFWE